MFSLWQKEKYECKLGKLCRLLEFKRAIGLSSFIAFICSVLFFHHESILHHIWRQKLVLFGCLRLISFLAGNTTHCPLTFECDTHSQQMSSWMFQGLNLPLSHRNLICCWQPMLVALVPNGSSVLCKRLLDVQLAGAMLLLLQHLVLLGTLLRHVNRWCTPVL